MPTYDYKCLECDIQFEQFQGITAPVLEECPDCGGKVKRLIGAGAGLIFKGSGFYTTDYRSEGYKESAKKDESSASDKSKTDKDKKETKQTDTSSEPTKSKATDD